MSSVLKERDGDVETWTINLPDQRNPLTGPETVDAIVAAVDEANADTNVRCIILTGAGSAFSAGGNIKDLQAGTGIFGGSPHDQTSSYRSGIQRVPRALNRLEVPVIAAVNGPAVGAGCDLAMMCDLRIASTRAFFAESFVKLGLIPGDGGAWLLTKALGPARAAEMTLTGDPVGAELALDWGIVSQVVEPEELLSAARALAERIVVNPPLAVRMAKRLLREAQSLNLHSSLELAAPLQAVAHHTKDHHEALSAMAEKRPGHYTGE